MTEPLSRCCGAPVRVEGDELHLLAGTLFWRCSQCAMPCDVVPNGFMLDDGESNSACKDLSNGQRVVLDVITSRSSRSHRHVFAELDAAWATLPEHLATAPWAANPDTFRKHLLIVCGYSNARVITTASPVEARHIASVLS